MVRTWEGDVVLVQDTDDLLAAVLLEHRRQLGAVQGVSIRISFLAQRGNTDGLGPGPRVSPPNAR